MKVIGVTGGIGAGKSEILNFIADNWNATVVEADEVGYLVMRPGKTCFAPIVELFGPGILKEDGTLNREEIARKVFEDKELLNPRGKPYLCRQLYKKCNSAGKGK